MSPKRRRTEIREIEDKSAKLVAFSKRKKGLFGKAAEIEVLCGARVGILVFSPAGKPYVFGEDVVDEALLGNSGKKGPDSDFSDIVNWIEERSGSCKSLADLESMIRDFESLKEIVERRLTMMDSSDSGGGGRMLPDSCHNYDSGGGGGSMSDTCPSTVIDSHNYRSSVSQVYGDAIAEEWQTNSWIPLPTSSSDVTNQESITCELRQKKNTWVPTSTTSNHFVRQHPFSQAATTVMLSVPEPSFSTESVKDNVGHSVTVGPTVVGPRFSIPLSQSFDYSFGPHIDPNAEPLTDDLQTPMSENKEDPVDLPHVGTEPMTNEIQAGPTLISDNKGFQLPPNVEHLLQRLMDDTGAELILPTDDIGDEAGIEDFVQSLLRKDDEISRNI